MKIVKDWTTLELIEFMNSYGRMSVRTLPRRYRPFAHDLVNAVLAELENRHPLIALSYKL